MTYLLERVAQYVSALRGDRKAMVALVQRSLFVLAALVALLVVFRPGNRESAVVDYRDPTTWLSSSASGDVVQVNGATGDISARIEVGEARQQITAADVGGGAVAVNHSASSASLVDGASLTIANTVDLGGADARVVADEEIAFLVRGTTVQAVDPATLALSTPVDAEESLTGAAIDRDGTFWAVGLETGDIVRVANGELRRFNGPGDSAQADLTARAFVAVNGRAHLVDAEARQVRPVRSNGSLGRATCLTSRVEGVVMVGGSADDGLDADRVPAVTVVADGSTGTTQIAYVDEGRCASVGIGSPGDQLGAPVESQGVAFVPNYTTGEIVILDVASASVIARENLGTGRNSAFELFEHDSIVWFNDPNASIAAVLDRTGLVRRIDKLAAATAGDILGTAGDEVGVSAVDGTGTVPGDSTLPGNSGNVGNVGEPGDDPGPTLGGPDGSIADSADDPVDALPSSTTSSTLLPVAEEPVANTEPPQQAPPGPEPTPTTEATAEAPPNTEVTSTSSTSSTVPEAEDPLIADFDFSASLVREGQTVFFTDRSLGSPTSWTWTFGDGTTATGPTAQKAWEEEGRYTVTLIVDRDDETSRIQTEIQVLPEGIPVPPQANFTFSSATIEAGESVTFTDISTGEPTSWNWDFGDGDSTSGRPEVSHVFEEAGAFTVTLVVANDDGEDVASAVITVLDKVDKPDAIIQGDATATVGASVVFSSASTGSPTSHRWDFGDGNTAQGESVRHTFTEAGTYRVQLFVENSAGQDSDTLTVVVSEPVIKPVARFEANPTEVLEGQLVSFVSLSLNNPDTLEWDFGDGTYGSGPTVDHVYDDEGNYLVTLTATNSAGVDTAQARIEVEEGGEEPQASFSFTPKNPGVGQLVSFTDNSADGPTAWSWDMGDGTTKTVANPSHAYAAPGTYTVTLVVSNAIGVDSTTRKIKVRLPKPAASFRVEGLPGQIGEPLRFVDQSSNSPNAWEWDFGDGTFSTEANPVHTYSEPGTYTVWLTVFNASGSDAESMVIEVSPPAPVASFQFA
ncbi:MAG: PKD domain-containing protein, partial [Acidimicrobiales bacterium]|nr:PKD domain-containing protein [Acidimicrobiales bacterium]